MTDTTVTNAKTASAYNDLLNLCVEASVLGSTGALLGWDQETMMPAQGLDLRGRQMAQIARMSHQMRTDPKIGELLAICEADAELMADPHSVAAANVRGIRREYDKSTKLPADLVEEMAKTTTQSKAHWAAARKANEFAQFLPWLEKIVELKRRQAECFGWPQDGEPWDALADLYEPGCTAKYVTSVFAPLREKLVALVEKLMASSQKPSDAFLREKLPIEQQMAFVRFVAEKIGFDFKRGRLDISTHPFCGGTHTNDIRMTTRFHDDNVLDALGSTMHESGHGMYEQGLKYEHFGTPAGDAISLGIHESQSRLWENQVGRSRAFWQWLHPKLGEFFGQTLATKYTLDDVYGAANLVQPDFIRVEADEATYNLHVMVRFEIERGLMNGSIRPADVPGVWNAKYNEYLGVTVPNDAKGCLQDVHWSMGAIGYFPTYTLGNLYCAQFFEKAAADLGNLDEMFAAGEFSALKRWLNEHIHQHGQRYEAAELCEVVTGKPLSAEPLLRHLESKLLPLYGC